MKRFFYMLALCLSCSSVAQAGDIWVSPAGNDNHSGTREAPLRTVAQAVKQAREWRRLRMPEAEGGICIHLAEGVYPQSEPLFIRPEDSGTADSPTLLRGEGDAVISGGVRVEGWRPVAAGEAARLPQAVRGKVWVADAPVVGNRHLEFRQFWVNGRKAQRASQFADGVMERMYAFDPVRETITIPTPDLPDPSAADQLEMLVHQRWAIAILRVRSLDVQGDSTIVRFHNPESRLEFAHPWPQPVIGGEKGNSSFCLVNDLALLDEPGEWFQAYPSGKIYYYPRPGEDMTRVAAIAPALESLMRVDGSLERPVHHLTFENIRFEHTAWNRPSREGHVTLQGGLRLLDAYKLAVPGLPEKASLENQAWVARPEAAIRVRGAHDIRFERCTFRHLGATGLDYEWAVHHSSVSQSLFTDIGGTALLMGAFPDGGFETHVPFKPVNADELCSHLTVTDNLITEVTNEDWGCVGIGAGYVNDVVIAHNEVSHVNYSGICVGWGWTLRESGMKNNLVENNYVHHFARRLYDAGGLYTLSCQPGSRMCGNRIEHLTDAPYATNDRAFYIYFDEATDGYTVADNWCPEERFDSNQPGPHNVWKTNGPSVDEGIRMKAGRRTSAGTPATTR